MSQTNSTILTNLNNIRTNPSSVVKSFLITAKGLERFKKKKEGQELADFSKTLETKDPVSSLKLSEGLCKAAREKLEVLVRNKEQNSGNIRSWIF
jgi:hypothetical protein